MELLQDNLIIHRCEWCTILIVKPFGNQYTSWHDNLIKKKLVDNLTSLSNYPCQPMKVEVLTYVVHPQNEMNKMWSFYQLDKPHKFIPLGRPYFYIFVSNLQKIFRMNTSTKIVAVHTRWSHWANVLGDTLSNRKKKLGRNIFSNLHNVMGISSSATNHTFYANNQSENIFEKVRQFSERIPKAQGYQVTEHNWPNYLHEGMTIMTLQSCDGAFGYIDSIAKFGYISIEKFDPLQPLTHKFNIISN